MKEFVKGLALFAHKYPVLHLTTQTVSTIFTAIGIAGLVIWLFPKEATISAETAATMAKMGLPFFLPVILTLIGFFNSMKWQKIPEIAKDKALKILKESPQLSPPLSNHVELVKWIKSYEALSLKKEKLVTITEQLNKLPELETSKEKLETKIKTLKSEVRIS